MPFFTLSFLLGVLTLPLFTKIPHLVLFLPGIIITAAGWKTLSSHWQHIAKFLCAALLGCVFVLFRSEQILQWQLPEQLETKTLTVTGTIASLPTLRKDDMKFEFLTDSINHQPQRTRIELSWYKYPGTPLRASERWQFQARLKRPHSLLNPGGFDYEKWLFSKGIRATGYIVYPDSAKRLSAEYWQHPINALREYLLSQIKTTLAGQPTTGLITALIVGTQNDITQEQWDIMSKTGTNHLMAIAGVHIAFVSGFLYFIVKFLWRRSAYLTLRVPASQAATAGAFVMALIYSALAGFSLPTQRALIMMAVFTVSVFGRRKLNPWNAFCLALLLVTLWDPLSTLSVSFWLSFGAVAAIIYGITGRIKPSGLWWKYGRVQWVITIALIPLCLMLFQRSSLISLAANIIAVPAVGIFVLPLCLLGALLVLIYPPTGYLLLLLAAKSIAVIWQFLAILGNIPGAVWQQTMPNLWILMASLVGIALLLAPRGFPARFSGLFWLAPIIFFKPNLPSANSIRFNLLDVGQGLSGVIQTQHHTLIFDAGPPMGEANDAGNRVILPFLQSAGIRRIDTLVISHGDSDHTGGALSLLDQVPVNQILTSVPERFPMTMVRNCQKDQAWEWDGILFRIIYPAEQEQMSLQQNWQQDNNSSCVLRIETPSGKTILLTGDIEKSAEAYLIATATAALHANILVAPHHGSDTSSTQAFVNAVHPQYVLFPVGYKNRYHFPSKAVIARYEQAGAVRFDTASDGAIALEIESNGEIKVSTQRETDRKIWR